MISQYHILNGDVLKEQFPDQIAGETIVCRECLVDGPVDGDSLEQFFETRAEFISESYGGFTKKEYYLKTVSEFKKICTLPHGAEINLWFEEDLFCQVNFWFVCSLLNKHSKNYGIHLVRPGEPYPYSFGKLDEEELVSIYDKKKPLKDINRLADLWGCYQRGDVEQLLNIGRELENELPFLLPAIQAHIERIPSGGSHGRPTESLVKIQKELKTNDFGTVFREFSKREAIYGYGDLQVKRLLSQLPRT